MQAVLALIKETREKIVALSLYGNQITDLDAVRELLTQLPALRVLWLNENPVAEGSALKSLVESEFKQIEVLNSEATANFGAWGAHFVTCL